MEQSADLTSEDAPRLARRADNSVFGLRAPGAATAVEFWSAVSAERRAMSAGSRARRRLRAAVAVGSFRRR